MAREGQWVSNSITATLTESLATVATIPCANFSILQVNLETSNNSALDQFVIQIKAHKDATFQSMYDSPIDFTEVKEPLKLTTGDLTNLAANSQGMFMMDVRGIYQVNLQAAQASGSATTLSIYTGGN